jgi:uncharacterized protein (DUF885 family)
MKRRDFILRSLGGAAAVASGSWPRVEQAPQQVAPAVPPADPQFLDLVGRHFDGYFHFHPDEASSAGFHPYDAELPAYSQAEINAEIRRLEKVLEELSTIPRAQLSQENQFDARLLEGSLRGQILDLKTIRRWERDPNYYNNIVSSALFVLIQRDFAPLEDRLKSLIARSGRVPEVLASARANIQNPPAIYTQIATFQVAAEIDFLKSQLPQAVAGAKNETLKASFAKANGQAIQAYQDFLNWLNTDLTPRSHGDFAIGEENYRQKLLYDEMVSTPIAELLQIGETELRKTQAAFQTTAAVIDSSKTPLQVLADVSNDHPDAAHLLAEAQGTLEKLRAFVTSHNVATIPSPVNPQVVETPAFMRALTFASMDTPGPFETGSTQAFFNVTLPESDWPDARKEELLRFFNRASLQIVAAHEVFPGHYTQFLWVKKAPTKVRKLVGCSSNAEGWAHYAEQMMLEQGYGEGDPKLLLTQLQMALQRVCRYIVGIRMHTRGMTLEEGTQFFQDEGYMEAANAEREAKRGTSDPTYLVYTLGKLEILKLKEDYKKQAGDDFNLKQFHDRFLSYGYPPIKLIREEILGNDTPTL